MEAAEFAFTSSTQRRLAWLLSNREIQHGESAMFTDHPTGGGEIGNIPPILGFMSESHLGTPKLLGSRNARFDCSSIIVYAQSISVDQNLKRKTGFSGNGLPVASKKYSLKRSLYLRIAKKLSEFQMSSLLLTTAWANPFAITPPAFGVT
jgi:hypothetical protein